MIHVIPKGNVSDRLACRLIELDLVEQLDVLAIDRSMPQALRMNNRPELISNAFAQWASETGQVLIPPGQPWRNGYVESFNGKLRDKCLNVNHFYPLNHAEDIIDIWNEEYNTIRPHSCLGYLTLSVHAGQCAHQKPVATLEATGPKTGDRSLRLGAGRWRGNTSAVEIFRNSHNLGQRR